MTGTSSAFYRSNFAVTDNSYSFRKFGYTVPRAAHSSWAQLAHQGPPFPLEEIVIVAMPIVAADTISISLTEQSLNGVFSYRADILGVTTSETSFIIPRLYANDTVSLSLGEYSVVFATGVGGGVPINLPKVYDISLWQH